MTRAFSCLFMQRIVSIPEYLQKWHKTLCKASIAILAENAALLATTINGLQPQYYQWVDQGACTIIIFFSVKLCVVMSFKRQLNDLLIKCACVSAFRIVSLFANFQFISWGITTQAKI